MYIHIILVRYGAHYFRFPKILYLIKNPAVTLEYQKSYDGLNSNLFELYLEYPEICTPIFERLAYESEYRRILERFEGDACPIILSDRSEERIIQLLEEKQKTLKRILTY